MDVQFKWQDSHVPLYVFTSILARDLAEDEFNPLQNINSWPFLYAEMTPRRPRLLVKFFLSCSLNVEDVVSQELLSNCFP